MNIKAFKSLVLLVFGVLLLGQFQEVFPQKVPLEPARTAGSSPTLYTEKGVYFFGEDVAVRGEGFNAFDTVLIRVRRTDVATIDGFPEVVATEWTVIADHQGAVNTVWNVNFPGTRFAIDAIGSGSKLVAGTEFIVFAHTANLDQCRNGTRDAPNDCTGSNWVNGDLNASQAHYIEGESVPYRLILSNLALGLHNVTIEYDSTESAKHSIDYLTTYNRSETTAMPCDGVAGCNPSLSSTRAIPIDPEVTKGFDGILGTADDIVQVPGVMTLFGGNITGISGYTMTGTYAGSSQTRLTINFTATSATVVFAWGGHIARRQDWGDNNSAIAISGAPYHMRVYDVDGEGGGNQDRSMQSGAVYYPGRITITKDAQPDTIVAFGFTAVGPGASDFVLDDDGDATNTYPNTNIFDNLTNFGSGHTVTVTESTGGGYWSLTQINCTSDPNGGAGTNNNVISVPGRFVEIFLEEGEFVNCTFVNTVVTASAVTIKGRVFDSFGRPIPGARLTLVAVSSGDVKVARTNPFGLYAIEDVPGGESVIITVYAKGYSFKVPSMLLTPTGDMTNVDFEALPPE